MKEVKEYPVEYRVFICDICGNRSVNKADIEICEASHNCDHKEREILFTGYGVDLYKGLREVCIKCGKTLGKVYFEDFEKRQGKLKELYEIMQIKRNKK